MKYLRRHAEKTLKRLASEFPAVLITGARQTGKTTMLRRYTDSLDIPHLTFDDPSEEQSAARARPRHLQVHGLISAPVHGWRLPRGGGAW